MDCRLYDRENRDNDFESYVVSGEDWLEEGRREGRLEMLYSEEERLRLTLSSLGCALAGPAAARFFSLGDDEDSSDCSVVVIDDGEAE